MDHYTGLHDYYVMTKTHAVCVWVRACVCVCVCVVLVVCSGGKHHYAIHLFCTLMGQWGEEREKRYACLKVQ